MAFTGSTDTAPRDQPRARRAHDAAIGVLIAETGGQNALIADSSALPEQLVKDALASAFTSAGQRCSAARVLFVREDIADKVVHMLAGAMAELSVGDPAELSTDVGPVIDADAKACSTTRGEDGRDRETHRRGETRRQRGTRHLLRPRAWNCGRSRNSPARTSARRCTSSRWKADELDQVIDAINATGYGLTLGIHSRIGETVDRIVARQRRQHLRQPPARSARWSECRPFGGRSCPAPAPRPAGPTCRASPPRRR